MIFFLKILVVVISVVPADVFGQPTTQNVKLNIFRAILSNNTALIDNLFNDEAAMNSKDSDSLTALILAVKNNNLDTVKVILDNGVDVDAPGKWNFTALAWAAYESNVDMAEYLIANGADVNKRIENNETALD